MLRVIRSRFFVPFVLLATFATAEPAAGQQIGFGDRPARDIVLPQFTDADVGRLVMTLDAVLPDELAPAEWGQAARRPLWDFVRRLQDGRLTAEQEIRVLEHLEALEKRHPESAPVLLQARQAVSTLTVGKQAPDIVGTNLGGEPMKLSDYRGKVVVLKFGGAWCAICRTEYPYERFLLELYAAWPFAIVGVDSSETLDSARRGFAEHGLNYPAWWDGRSGADDRGPIAAAWNVQGWPTTYVLDADGVIRFVDLRSEDLMKAVRQLLVDEQRRLIKANTGKPR